MTDQNQLPDTSAQGSESYPSRFEALLSKVPDTPEDSECAFFDSLIGDNAAERTGAGVESAAVLDACLEAVEPALPLITANKVSGYGPLRLHYLLELARTLANKVAAVDAAVAEVVGTGTQAAGTQAAGAQAAGAQAAGAQAAGTSGDGTQAAGTSGDGTQAAGAQAAGAQAAGAQAAGAAHPLTSTRGVRELRRRAIRALKNLSGRGTDLRKRVRKAAKGDERPDERARSLETIAKELEDLVAQVPPRIASDAGATPELLSGLRSYAGALTNARSRVKDATIFANYDALNILEGHIIYELRVLSRSLRDARKTDKSIPDIRVRLIGRRRQGKKQKRGKDTIVEMVK